MGDIDAAIVSFAAAFVVLFDSQLTEVSSTVDLHHYQSVKQDMYTQALEVCPLMSHNQRAVYFANRAACYMRQEEHAQAAIECSAALELNPSYTKALIRRALAFEAIGELEKALVDLQKAKELDPGNVSVAELLARVGPAVEKQREAMKEEMMGKLKELGNTVLGKFGLSLDNFKAEKDPSTGSYSIKFQQ